MKLIITGGHHSSAIPLIHKILSERQDVKIFWLGHRHSLKGDQNDTLEYREITALNIPFYELTAGKVYRTFNPLNLIKVPLGFFQALFYLVSIKPDVILSFGGYIAAPTVVAGWLLNIPSLTHEQTVVAGYSNRMISHFVKKILVSWKESEKYFPKEKIVYTGIPLRESIYSSTSDSFQTDNLLPYVYFTAGKTGSIKLNQAVKDSLPKLLMFCNVIHQCGDFSVTNYFDQLNEYYTKIKSALTGKYFLRKFVLENEIGEAYKRSTMVVGRSGAHTVSEIMALKKPALLVPIPWVSHNEQHNNALIVKNAGLGEILLEKDLTSESLVERIKYMLHNLGSYQNRSATDFRETSKYAAGLILKEVIKYAPKKD